MLRAKDGFCEDAACAIVAGILPALLTAFERCCAERSIKDWWPDAWEAIFAAILQPGESHVKDRRAFEAKHADDWIVISALHWEYHIGMTAVADTQGGKRDPHPKERHFLVATMDYEVGRFGFVIDETRHKVYGGPSSFSSWSGANAV